MNFILPFQTIKNVKKIAVIFLLCSVIISCSNKKEKIKDIKSNLNNTNLSEKKIKKDTLTKDKIAASFDFPVGKPNAEGYYSAQKFKKNFHLGDDWNAVTGGNSDLGDPIYAIANGYVQEAKDFKGGWGNVVRIIHFLPNKKQIVSLYAHCDTITTKANSWVKKGDKIGTIGTANGKYYAHLHFEIRDDITLPLGPGYSEDTSGYLDPTKFIKEHRVVK